MGRLYKRMCIHPHVTYDIGSLMICHVMRATSLQQPCSTMPIAGSTCMEEQGRRRRLGRRPDLPPTWSRWITVDTK